MNKIFKFKLSGLLKLRKFKEEKLKIEISSILKKIEDTKAEIKNVTENLKEVYLSQEELLKKGATGNIVRAYPEFIQAKREDIQGKKKYLETLVKKYEETMERMRKAMGDVKVIKKMELRDKKKHKLKMEKKNNEIIEEIINMRRGMQ